MKIPFCAYKKPTRCKLHSKSCAKHFLGRDAKPRSGLQLLAHPGASPESSLGELTRLETHVVREVTTRLTVPYSVSMSAAKGLHGRQGCAHINGKHRAHQIQAEDGWKFMPESQSDSIH